ncbi:hypothetical protein L2E82_38196 [Cichorium intybus]|uniref:Uncharacterized protein n=1 Tax=Cichorium intybus TaxID=13427 RepID=A0ACB9AF38_CICIN|nr:hypothetical protein L2E82_38196 [Cichorium intybus]
MIMVEETSDGCVDEEERMVVEDVDSDDSDDEDDEVAGKHCVVAVCGSPVTEVVATGDNGSFTDGSCLGNQHSSVGGDEFQTASCDGSLPEKGEAGTISSPTNPNAACLNLISDMPMLSTVMEKNDSVVINTPLPSSSLAFQMGSNGKCLLNRGGKDVFFLGKC